MKRDRKMESKETTKTKRATLMRREAMRMSGMAGTMRRMDGLKRTTTTKAKSGWKKTTNLLRLSA